MDSKLELGTIQSGRIVDENDKKYFVQIEGINFELKKEELPKTLENGEEVDGFIYENKAHKNVITTVFPDVQQWVYGKGKVVDVRRDLGVFVDIGLPDKDVVVSLDDLPLDKYEWPKKDDVLMLKLKTDNKGRLWGHLADIDLIDQLVRSAPENMKNKFVNAVVIANRNSGTFVLTDDFYIGFIHPDESTGTLRLGEKVKARILGVSHNRFNLSTKPFAYEEISDDAEMILTVLKHAKDNKIPYTDKSDPVEIKDYFGISKGSFKRALGNLMKNRLIKQEDGYTFLIKNED